MPGSHPPTLRGFCYWGAHPLPTHRDQIPTCRDSGLPQKDFEIVSKSYLMDGGFATREDITALEQRSVSVYAPVRLPRNRPEHERYQPRYEDGPEVVRWRQRMATEEAKAIYRQRGSIAEWTNAQVRLHGVSQFSVRGLAKVTTVMLLVAVAHNLLRWGALMS